MSGLQANGQPEICVECASDMPRVTKIATIDRFIEDRS